jgi:HSP20 family protein
MPKFLQKREAADPFAFMRRVTEELDRAFGLRGEVPVMPEVYPRMWTPQVEVFERGEKFIVRVDLPGLTKEDVRILRGKESWRRRKRKRVSIGPSAHMASSIVVSGFPST